MRTPKTLYHTTPTIYPCELTTCPQCHTPLMDLPYVNGRKTIQTMTTVMTIADRPKHCVNPDCPERTTWPAVTWQHLAPKGGTYGYDVIAQLGWERQHGRRRFADVQSHLKPAVQIRYHLNILGKLLRNSCKTVTPVSLSLIPTHAIIMAS